MTDKKKTSRKKPAKNKPVKKKKTVPAKKKSSSTKKKAAPKKTTSKKAPVKKPAKRKSKPKKTTGKKLTRLAMLIAVWGLIFGFVMLLWFTYDLPSIDNVKPLDTKPSITILARDGSLIERYGGLKGNTVEVQNLPAHTIAAVLSIEDRRFYDHFGIDPFGLARAMWVNIREGGFVQGGSTITQQLAKNLFLTPEKTIRRKVQEALMALWIEQKFTKDEILSAYLNRVYYGAGAYGIDAASQTYFNKPASKLNLWESAVLAGLLKAPSRYSPATNPQKAKERALTVLAAMQDAGYISDHRREDETAQAEIVLDSKNTDNNNRYFTDWVIDRIDNFITVSDRDLVIKTTLSPRLQELALQSQKDFIKTWTEDQAVSQMAMVTLSPDGSVLAMVGGTDYSKSQFNRATQAQRQPGSAFKPFVYLAALETGFKPSDKIKDEKIRYGDYAPENYDGTYRGDVTLTEAMALSLNTATVNLLNDIGVAKLMDTAQRAGIQSTLKPELALALGVSEVNLLELTTAYAVLENGGHQIEPHAITEISDKDGNIFYLHTNNQYPQVFATRDIRDIQNMLRRVVTDGTARAAQIDNLNVGGKTGTSQEYRDAWFVGYTGNMITGVWMGNDDNTPMNHITGGSLPARYWHRYMSQTLSENIAVSAPPRMNDPGSGGFIDMLNNWTGGNWSSGNQEPEYNR